jgi:NADPH:quinone reductase-like Zn-dependent oxidoreductase
MKAALIDSLERGPRYADFDEPVVTGGETLVEVTAAGPHPIVRMLASGEHYGSHGALPMIPGIDGTGRTADGTCSAQPGVRTFAQAGGWPAPCGRCSRLLGAAGPYLTSCQWASSQPTRRRVRSRAPAARKTR